MSNTPDPGPANEKLVQRLYRVLEISRQLAVATDLMELLRQIELAALEVLDCERATVCLYDKQTDELYSCVATRAETIRFPAGQGIAGECFRTGTVSNVPDAYAEPRFNRAIDAKTGFRTRNLLTCPLTAHDQTVLGVLQALNRRGQAFDQWDETLIRTLGAQCGVAFQRHFLLQEHLEKQRLERELNIAHSIQQALLPKKPLSIPGFELAGWNQPAEATGGDFFDYRPLDSGQSLLTIADVTGHGVGPALVAAQTHALIRAMLTARPEVMTGLTRINQLLSEDLPADRFVTAMVGLLNPKTAELTYVSAGQGPLLFFHAATGEVRKLPIHGPPLGIMPDLPYDEHTTLHFESGDMLVLLTDGFYEWENAEHKMYGFEGFAETVRNGRDLSASELIKRLHSNLMGFVQGTKQLDDLTAVIVKKL
jgi:phosphoserine phosphatase